MSAVCIRKKTRFLVLNNEASPKRLHLLNKHFVHNPIGFVGNLTVLFSPVGKLQSQGRSVNARWFTE